MQHLMTSDGQIVLPGAMLCAKEGPHAGTHWRLDRVFHNGVTHVLRCTRLHKIGRVVEHFHPSVFGLSLVQITRWFQITRRDLAHAWHKVDEWLFAGIFALIPLAIFEAYHGGDVMRSVIESVFNSHVNTGGGH